MPINYRADSSWKNDTKAFLKQVEPPKNTFNLHDDGRGIPTLGYGFALVRDNDGWEVPNDLDEKLQAAGLEPPDSQTRRTLRKIADYKNAGKDTSSLVDSISGSNSPWQVSESPASTLLDIEVDAAETALKNRLQAHLGETAGANLFQTVQGTREGRALLSLAYNNAGPLIGDGLAGALADGNRAEAWYEIRYNSNAGALSASPPNTAEGIATRRYAESAMFGLSDGDAPTEAEALEAYRTFAKHRDTILAYEGRYRDEVSDAQALIDGAASRGGANLNVPTVQEAFAGARNKLVAAYGEAGIPIDYRDIQVAPEAGGTLQGTRRDGFAIGTGAHQNDLLIGRSSNDGLAGAGGADVLYGGEGTDALDGRKGATTASLVVRATTPWWAGRATTSSKAVPVLIPTRSAAAPVPSPIPAATA
ncbi:hypothetical protein [Thiohalorhabdus sp.]|uniref:hypothetical protein n=1 Tax=Thiohalorhabdus sp. TaxID=3094134 RepID=UPI002FC3D821